MENEIIKRTDEYYISYNPACFDHGKAETALCVRDSKTMFGTRFYILLGDWRKQYNETSNLDEAMEVFKANKEHIGPTSN